MSIHRNDFKLYSSLIEMIRGTDIDIEIRNDMGGTKYNYRRKIHPNYVESPQIRVARKVTVNQWLEKNMPCADFINGSVNIKEEIICMAHEFGHHFSNQKEIDRVYDEIHSRKNYKSINEKNKIMTEEKYAWSKAKEILFKLKFKNWRIFNSIRKDSLRTYENVPICYLE